MVLVANKKTKEQMKEDLGLFLHQHAEVFTTWLQDILNKLQQVTKPKSGSAADASKSKKLVKKKERTHLQEIFVVVLVMILSLKLHVLWIYLKRNL